MVKLENWLLNTNSKPYFYSSRGFAFTVPKVARYAGWR